MSAAGTEVREALVGRITAYLSGGGLFNPEMADHEAVRDLLIECRDALAATLERAGDGAVPVAVSAPSSLTVDLATELWAMAQGPGPIEDAALRMAARIEESDRAVSQEACGHRPESAGAAQPVAYTWKEPNHVGQVVCKVDFEAPTYIATAAITPLYATPPTSNPSTTEACEVAVSDWDESGSIDTAIDSVLSALGETYPREALDLDAAREIAGTCKKAIAALRYYKHECSGAEPSLSVFHQMVDEALGDEAAPQPSDVSGSFKAGADEQGGAAA